MAVPECVWTIGHSSRTLEEFLALLHAHRVQLIADVRRYPGSRRYPHFNADALKASLEAESIGYLALPQLGGRRKPRADSPHTIWRHESFRGYADYMDTESFEAALATLMAAASERRCAIMCSEAMWWQCHRAMIADALKARGVTVLHIRTLDEASEHPYTCAASIVDGKLCYGAGSNPAQR